MEALRLEVHPIAKDRITRVATKDGDIKEIKNKTGKV
jgi:hypothetical protein